MERLQSRVSVPVGAEMPTNYPYMYVFDISSQIQYDDT